ncbi:hypothetical protein KEJ52_05715 [Candidatus Bathyarchaeota archaeon]|nr:hypothetical protein [Candidatus Bathyarchaeota archaeon]
MPTFGYTSPGASTQGTGQRISGSVFTCPENCVAESISYYTASSGSGSSRQVSCAIYRHSDSAFIAETERRTFTSWSPGWLTFNFQDPKPQLQAGVEYVLVVFNTSSLASPNITYDAGDFPEQGHYQSWTNYPLPSTANFTHENRKYSIYCTYTPLAPSQTVTWSQTGILNHVYSRPNRAMKLSQNINVSHFFVHHRIMWFIQATRVLHVWTAAYPVLTIKQWTVSLGLTHAFRRPTRVIRLSNNLQLDHLSGVPIHFIRFFERLGLAHKVFVAVPSARKTKLFLVVGDLAIQITGD